MPEQYKAASYVVVADIYRNEEDITFMVDCSFQFNRWNKLL